MVDDRWNRTDAGDALVFVAPMVASFVTSLLIGGGWSWSVVLIGAPIGATAVSGRRHRPNNKG